MAYRSRKGVETRHFFSLCVCVFLKECLRLQIHTILGFFSIRLQDLQKISIQSFSFQGPWEATCYEMEI